jgi:hypothetical protein
VAELAVWDLGTADSLIAAVAVADAPFPPKGSGPEISVNEPLRVMVKVTAGDATNVEATPAAKRARNDKTRFM